MDVDQPERDSTQCLRDQVDALERKQRRRSESVQFLQLITRTFVSLSLTEQRAICDTLVSLVATFLEAEQGAMLLAADDADGLVVAARYGLSDDGSLVTPEAQTLWSTVMAEKAARTLSAEELNEQWPAAPAELAEGVAIVSVDVHDQGVGVMLAGSKLSGQPFDDVDLE
ncbi:MAG: GAF domain-containing protein, partial [Deltaproteobacteria bacterium]|nr:GAF domain-containing protein [Deltaproteobacteria bacterium]